ncbi:MAG: phospholipid carrier-dependent glycosyltransferase [Proteobacteria bacterium]|nr:phospholipid carrier-dependent glycosyltransferase [Pseudomonadota bacterium]
MRRRTLVFLLVLAAFHVVGDMRWNGLDDSIQTTDASYHYSQIAERAAAIQQGPAAFAELMAHEERQRYGQVWYAVATVMALIVDAPNVGHLLNLQSMLLWPLLLLLTYLLAAELAPEGRKETAGVLAALVAHGLPGLTNYARVIVLDLPLTVAVAAAAWLLLRLLRLEPGSVAYRRGAWFAAGASVLAIGIKVNAAAFLVGPAWVAVRPHAQAAWREDRRRLLLGIGGAGAAGLAVLLLGSRGDALMVTFRDATWPGKALDYADAGALGSWPADWAAGAWSHSWEAAYFTVLQTFTPALLVVTIAAYAWFFGRRRGCEDTLARAQRDAIFWWWAIPVIGLLLLLRGLYDERYALPLLPQAAALIGVALVELPGKPVVRRAAAGAVVLGVLATHHLVSFGSPPGIASRACVTVPGWADNERIGRSLWLCPIYPAYEFMDRPSTPRQHRQPFDALERALAPTRRAVGRPLGAVFLDDLYELFYGTFQRNLFGWDVFRHEDLLLLTHCADEGWMTANHGGPEALARHIQESADVVLARWGSARPGEPVQGLRCRIPWDDGSFRMGGSIPLEDGTQIRWWTRSPPRE